MAQKLFEDQGTNLLSTQRETRNDIRKANNDLTPKDPTENTLLQASTNIFIHANNQIIGMIQSFQISESRNINKLQAIGYEGVIQAVPSNTNGGQLSVSRIALYESNLWNALGLTTDGVSYNNIGSNVFDKGKDDGDTWDSTTPTPSSIEGKTVSSRHVFKTLKDQRVPFEIQVKTPRSFTDTSTDFYVETYIDCWLSSYSKSYTVGTITVAESATIQYADVY